MVYQPWDFRPGQNFVLEMQKAASDVQSSVDSELAKTAEELNKAVAGAPPPEAPAPGAEAPKLEASKVEAPKQEPKQA